MTYSKEFIREVKELYPDYPTIHKLVDTGDKFLGNYLNGSYGGVPIDFVLTALTLEEVQNYARIEKRKKNLYEKWLKEEK